MRWLFMIACSLWSWRYVCLIKISNLIRSSSVSTAIASLFLEKHFFSWKFLSITHKIRKSILFSRWWMISCFSTLRPMSGLCWMTSIFSWYILHWILRARSNRGGSFSNRGCILATCKAILCLNFLSTIEENIFRTISFCCCRMSHFCLIKLIFVSNFISILNLLSELSLISLLVLDWRSIWLLNTASFFSLRIQILDLNILIL
jgi:hypothetical protein